MLSVIRATPLHVVPPSSVTNANTSTPDVVSVGAVPPGHLTDAGHVCVPVPPFVSSKQTTIAPVAGTFSNVHEATPDIVFVKYLLLLIRFIEFCATAVTVGVTTCVFKLLRLLLKDELSEFIEAVKDELSAD